MSVNILERISIEPSAPAKACVIWLHGLGDSGAGFSPIVPVLNLPEDHGIRFVFPHAPEQAVTINQGYIMRSWYDIKSMDLHDRADMEGVLQSEEAVLALIEEQVNAGIPADKIVLAGFSQGGVVSIFTGLRCTKKLAGIMALSCYLPTADKLPENLSAANQATSILQQHGEQDEVVPLSAGKMAYDALQAAGYNTQWQTYNMQHTVSNQQLAHISQWLVSCLC